MRTRRVSHLPVAKGTKQWTPRLQPTILPRLEDGITFARWIDRWDIRLLTTA